MLWVRKPPRSMSAPYRAPPLWRTRTGTEPSRARRAGRARGAVCTITSQQQRWSHVPGTLSCLLDNRTRARRGGGKAVSRVEAGRTRTFGGTGRHGLAVARARRARGRAGRRRKGAHGTHWSQHTTNRIAATSVLSTPCPLSAFGHTYGCTGHCCTGSQRDTRCSLHVARTQGAY
jgi:hypothetical protein